MSGTSPDTIDTKSSKNMDWKKQNQAKFHDGKSLGTQISI
jgi:hypothetical protein